MTAQSSTHGKERDATSSTSQLVKEITTEVELPEEVKAAGVEKIQGAIELPPDIKKLGVTPGAAQTPIAVPATTVTLPISDDKIYQGTKVPLTSAFKWLAVWCLKRLKTAHLILKSIHGKIVRVVVK